MFKYRYKLAVVNEAKNIVTLTPTAGTWLKALAPLALFPVGLMVVGFIAGLKEDQPAAEEPFNLQETK